MKDFDNFFLNFWEHSFRRKKYFGDFIDFFAIFYKKIFGVGRKNYFWTIEEDERLKV